jgi:hypothetical protein
MAITSGSASKGNPRRRWRRWVALGGLVGLLAVAVPVAWASHQFTDVPDSSPFHGDIGAVKDAGITAGKTCVPPGTPPTYCPTEGITREAMAAFVHRGFGRAGLSSTLEVAIGDAIVDLGAVTIDVGGVTGNTQFVKLDAAVTTYIGSSSGCPCETQYIIWSDALAAPVSVNHFLTNDVTSPSGFGSASGAATAVVLVPTATSQTFRVLAVRSDPAPSTGVVTGYAQMSALTVPFGSTGGNTLSVTSRGGARASGSRFSR